ncbi:class III signal peptide-containing protein [uncultured Anaeromusa sp.]|uniref:Flp family type IVb pilin n=1 Tax=uncultured Anaeromusa sp. TaxID=673273 RepID=UPI0029C84CE4|nr:class III signal peptide-containing protein [uncultured Anaeromusa sp.]
MKLLISFLKNKGQTTVEYSLMLLLVFLAAVGAISLLGTGVQEIYNDIINRGQEL